METTATSMPGIRPQRDLRPLCVLLGAFTLGVAAAGFAWHARRRGNRDLYRSGMESLFWHALLFACMIGVLLLANAVLIPLLLADALEVNIFLPLAVGSLILPCVMALVNLMVGVWGAWRIRNGKAFRYPLVRGIKAEPDLRALCVLLGVLTFGAAGAGFAWHGRKRRNDELYKCGMESFFWHALLFACMIGVMVLANAVLIPLLLSDAVALDVFLSLEVGCFILPWVMVLANVIVGVWGAQRIRRGKAFRYPFVSRAGPSDANG